MFEAENKMLQKTKIIYLFNAECSKKPEQTQIYKKGIIYDEKNNAVCF